MANFLFTLLVYNHHVRLDRGIIIPLPTLYAFPISRQVDVPRKKKCTHT